MPAMFSTREKPERIPLNVLFDFTDTTIAVFHPAPKAIFHTLVLPRISRPPNDPDPDFEDLQSLLNSKTVGKEKAKAVLEDLGKHAQKVKREIEEEMIKMYGFVWPVWTGFHAVTSLKPLHLHVISTDFCSVDLVEREDYNSFHPQHGFFLRYDVVMSWFDTAASVYKEKSSLFENTYQPLLHRDLVCHRCRKYFLDIATLKEHLQKDFDKVVAAKNPALPKPQSHSSDKKRKDAPDNSNGSHKPASKRSHQAAGKSA